MKKIKKISLIVAIIVALIIIDQVIKTIIPREPLNIIEGTLKLTYTENTGGAFGIGGDSLIAIILANVIVLGIAIRFLIVQFDKIDKPTKVMICLIIAGGASNFIDRLIKGYVVDYIDINEIFPYPIFNLADICIVIGWVGLVILTIKATAKSVKKK